MIDQGLQIGKKLRTTLHFIENGTVREAGKKGTGIVHCGESDIWIFQ